MGTSSALPRQPYLPGQHVHTHNLIYEELDTLQVEVPARPARPTRTSTRTFEGYLRPDGRVGTRNYLAVVAASNCAAFTANLIADSFKDNRCRPM